VSAKAPFTLPDELLPLNASKTADYNRVKFCPLIDAT
jgi:hypothetical protein